MKWNRVARSRGVTSDVLNLGDLQDFVKDCTDSGITDRGAQIVINGGNLSIEVVETVDQKTLDLLDK
jgi:hypothetical protein